MAVHAAPAGPLLVMIAGMRRLSWLALVVISPALLSSGFAQAQEGPPGRANRPDIEDIRTRGSAAVREWVDARRTAEARRKSPERAEFDACMELAVTLHAEGAGDTVPEVLAEAEQRLVKARRGVARSDVNPARMHANLGAAQYRIVGDARAAQRLFKAALELDPHDEVALEGLAALQRDEEIDLQKEIETERLREIGQELERMPRSRPPERPRADSVNPQPQP